MYQFPFVILEKNNLKMFFKIVDSEVIGPSSNLKNLIQLSQKRPLAIDINRSVITGYLNFFLSFL